MEPRSLPASPFGWVVEHAETDGGAPALIFSDGVVTYSQLVEAVSRRVQVLRSDDSLRSGSAAGGGGLVPVPVRLDLASVVEILAHHDAGFVPVPTGGRITIPDGSASEGSASEGAVLAIATSGSSGERRLVPLTMANLSAAVTASRARLGTGPDDRWLACLPLDHIGGLSVLYRSFEAGGAAVVGSFDDGLSDLTDRAEPTVASLVPTMVHRMLAADADQLAHIGTVLVGGARLPWSLAERAMAAGVQLLTTYGSTETASQVATVAPGDRPRHPGDVGNPLDGFSVDIPNPDGDGVGTIVIDGPAVFGGYLGDEPRVGRFESSDIGRIDTDGRLTVVGRSDDMVISGGLNVSLTAVEDALAGMPGVRAVAVVGLADEEWGAKVAAVVATNRSVGSIRTEAADLLEAHEVPQLWITDDVPLLPNGKPDRTAVRSLFT